LTAPATIIAPLFGGIIVDAIGSEATFGISMVIAIAMTSILFLLAKDPQKQICAQTTLLPETPHPESVEESGNAN
jgi:hypothetical protein